MGAIVRAKGMVEAHVLGLNWLREAKRLPGGGTEVFCLGIGNGFSVREVLDHSRHVTNLVVPVVEGPRRGGDAVKLVSGSEKAGQVLGWQPPRSTLPSMISDAWRWHQTGSYGG